MSDVNQSQDFLQQTGEKKKIPGSINVLTILTFIGCGILGLLTLAMSTFMKWSLKMIEKAQETGQLTEKQLTDMEKAKIGIDKYLANQWSLTIVGLLGVIFCVYGAMQMRKLKKEGFYIYILGELLPWICGIVLLGFASQFNGVLSYVFLAVNLFFIIMYAANLKHMKK